MNGTFMAERMFVNEGSKNFMAHMRIIIFLISALVVLNGCSSNGQQPKDGSWVVTIQGKVGFPQSGNISIMELTRSGKAWQDTIKLKSNYTYVKKITLKEPG